MGACASHGLCFCLVYNLLLMPVAIRATLQAAIYYLVSSFSPFRTADKGSTSDSAAAAVMVYSGCARQWWPRVQTAQQLCSQNFAGSVQTRGMFLASACVAISCSHNTSDKSCTIHHFVSLITRVSFLRLHNSVFS